MAKTLVKEICMVVQSQANAPEYTVPFLEAATQTFKNGGTTCVVAGGYVQDTASDTPALIIGVPAEDAHNDAVQGTSTCTINLANTTNVFEANCLETALADHVLAASDIGVVMAIQRDTVNNKLFLNASTKAGANVRVFTLALGRNTDIGDTNGRLLFVWLPNNAQSLGTS